MLEPTPSTRGRRRRGHREVAARRRRRPRTVAERGRAASAAHARQRRPRRPSPSASSRTAAAARRLDGIRLRLDQRDRRRRRCEPSRAAHRVAGVLPALVGQAGAALVEVLEQAVLVRRRVVGRASQRPPAGSAAAPRPRPRASPSARRRAAADPERRGVDRAVVDGRQGEPAVGSTYVVRRSSCGILPGASAGRRRRAVPCRRASARSVPAASSVPKGSIIRAAQSESRPNSVRYQGVPAAAKTSVRSSGSVRSRCCRSAKLDGDGGAEARVVGLDLHRRPGHRGDARVGVEAGPRRACGLHPQGRPRRRLPATR